MHSEIGLMKWGNNLFPSLDHDEQLKTREVRIRNADGHEELLRTRAGYSTMLNGHRISMLRLF